MAMLNPPHPGLSVKHDCIEALGLTVTRAAQVLGVSRQTLNDLVHGRRGISPEMAIRLDMAFGGGADTWIRLQAAYDLAEARKKAGAIKVERYEPTLSDRHVVNHPDGWAIKKEGAEEQVSDAFGTQREAEQRAEQIVGDLGGGEVPTRDRRGRSRDPDTVPPGNDPSPPRDRKL